MPIKKKNYPADWKEISARVKIREKGICQYCLKGPLNRQTMGSHHLDHDPMNNFDDNLVWLHSHCHLLFHSTYDSCRTRAQFDRIVKNYHSQVVFGFMKGGNHVVSEKISKQKVTSDCGNCDR